VPPSAAAVPVEPASSATDSATDMAPPAPTEIADLRIFTPFADVFVRQNE
jgi:hypothetical protein